MLSAWWAWHPTMVLDRAARHCGDVFRLDLARSPMTVLAAPELVEAAFQATGRGEDTAEANDVLLDVVGPASVLTTGGSRHRTERGNLRRFLADLPRIDDAALRERVDRAVAELSAQRPVALLPWLQTTTVEVLLHSMTGHGDYPALLRELALADVRASRSPWRELWRTGRPPWPLLARQSAALSREIRATTRTLRPDSALARVLATNSGALDSVAATLIVTGHETTATALAWTVERLVHTPPALAEAERAALRDDDSNHLAATVAEALRQRPVVPVLRRTIQAELPYRRGVIPTGTEAGLAAWLVHHRPEIYPDPWRFDPTRFLTADGQLEYPPAGHWFPFGGGTRSCLGTAFATRAARLVLGRLLARYRIRAVRTRAERPVRRSITIVPGRGAEVVLSPRH